MRPLFLRLLGASFAALVAIQLLAGVIGFLTADRRFERDQNVLVDHKLEWAADQLDSMPPERWPHEIHPIRKSLAIHLQVLPRDAPIHPRERSVILKNGDRLIADARIRPPPPLLWIALQVLMGGLAFGAVLFWLGRPVFRDLETLEAASRRIADGDLKARSGLKDGPVSDLGMQFDAMADRVEVLVTGQRELLAAVSHEIRTPMARMRFMVEADQIDRLDGELDAIDDLLGELLEMARMEQPPLETPDPGAAEELIEALCARMAGLSEATVECDVQGGVPMGTKDLARVVENLVSNAQRHAASKVRVQVRQGRLTVEDDGPGVPTERRSQVFEPFYTGERSRNRALGGVGLGLALVKRAAERWGATITLDTGELGGARFQLSWV